MNAPPGDHTILRLDGSRFIRRVYFFGADDGYDFLGASWRPTLRPHEWHLSYRFRYHADERAHDSADAKNFYSFAAGPGKGFAELEAAMEEVIRAARAIRGIDGDVSRVDLDTSDPRVALAILGRQPWFNVRREEPRS